MPRATTAKKGRAAASQRFRTDRPSATDAAARELERIEFDIATLKAEHEHRLRSLCRAYIRAARQLEKLRRAGLRRG